MLRVPAAGGSLQGVLCKDIASFFTPKYIDHFYLDSLRTASTKHTVGNTTGLLVKQAITTKCGAVPQAECFGASAKAHSPAPPPPHTFRFKTRTSEIELNHQPGEQGARVASAPTARRTVARATAGSQTAPSSLRSPSSSKLVHQSGGACTSAQHGDRFLTQQPVPMV